MLIFTIIAMTMSMVVLFYCFVVVGTVVSAGTLVVVMWRSHASCRALARPAKSPAKNKLPLSTLHACKAAHMI